MMKNEKIKNIIICILVFLLFIFGINFFRSCDSNTGTGAAITRNLQLIAGKMQGAIELLQSINPIITDIIRERDNYYNIAKQLRTATIELEQRYTNLQANYKELRKYQSENNEAVRSITESSNGIGNELDGLANELEKFDRLIREIQE